MARNKSAGRKRVTKSVSLTSPKASFSAPPSTPIDVSTDTIKTVNKRILRTKQPLEMATLEEISEGQEGDAAANGKEEEETETGGNKTPDPVTRKKATVEEGALIPEITDLTVEDGKGKTSMEKQHSEKDKVEGSVEHGNRLSFRDALAGNRANVNGKRLSFMPGYENGVISFTKKEVEKTTSKWKLSLLGMVAGSTVPFNLMQGFVRANWKEVKPPKIIRTDSGIFIFKFDNERDLEWVLQQGPWMVGGIKLLMLRRWSEGVHLDPSCFDSTQVWAILPNLDVRFWDELFFAKIGSALGKPIFVDKVTENEERMSFARILVEITADKPLKKAIAFHGEDGEIIEQQVLYEWVPNRCETCKVFGHSEGDCHRKPGFQFKRNLRPFARSMKKFVQKRVWVQKEAPTGLAKADVSDGKTMRTMDKGETKTLEDNSGSKSDNSREQNKEDHPNTSKNLIIEGGNEAQLTSMEENEKWITVAKRKKGSITNPGENNDKPEVQKDPGSRFKMLSCDMEDGDNGKKVGVDLETILPNEINIDESLRKFTIHGIK